MPDFFGCELSPSADAPERTSTPEILALLEKMRPWPSPCPLIRVGGDGDGAYLVPDDLEGITACFSPGVSNIKHFEDELADRFRIASHLCDYGIDLEKLETPLIEGLQTYEKKWLDLPGTKDSFTLAEWVAGHRPDPADDLVLQIDIEGAEYRNILHTPDSVLRRFRIIVIELHGLPKMRQRAIAEQVFRPFLDKLSGLFTCVHAHPNNCCGEWQVPGSEVRVPTVIELTLLRNDRMSVTRERHPVQLPHPLDVVNVDGRVPLFLDDSWLDEPRSIESRLLMVEQRLARQPDEETQALVEAMPRLFSLLAGASARIRGEAPESVRREWVDLAAGRPYRLRTSRQAGRREGIVERAAPYFFHTRQGRDQWITIDLGAPARLQQLVLENRNDALQQRARFLFYVAHDEPEADLSDGDPVNCHAGFLGAEPSVSRTALGGVRARYITLFSPVRTCLHLASIAVLGVAD